MSGPADRRESLIGLVALAYDHADYMEHYNAPFVGDPYAIARCLRQSAQAIGVALEREAELMNRNGALKGSNDAAIAACLAIIRERLDEDGIPGDPKCGDCNMGAGPHVRSCAYHAAKDFIAKAEQTP